MADAAARAQRVQRAIKALQKVGYESVGSLIDDLLECDRLDPLDRRHAVLALLARLEGEGNLVKDHDFRELVIRYSSRIADAEMNALVAHEGMRLLVQNANGDSLLESFDTAAIAQCQCRLAPLVTSVLKTAVGLPTVSDGSEPYPDHEVEDLDFGNTRPRTNHTRAQNRGLIATVALCMLSYARNDRANVLQMTAGYWAFADKASKRTMGILHRMGLLVAYESIRRHFKDSVERPRDSRKIGKTEGEGKALTENFNLDGRE